MLILEKENITVDLDFHPHENYYKSPQTYDYHLQATLNFTIMINGKIKRTCLDFYLYNHSSDNNVCSSDDISIEYEEGKYTYYSWDYKTVVGGLKILGDLGYMSRDELSPNIIQKHLKHVMQVGSAPLSSN